MGKINISRILFLIASIFITSEKSFSLSLVPPKIVEQLSTDFSIVKNCGEWQQSEQRGYYRLIVLNVYSGAASLVYIQMITSPTQESASRILKNISVTELNHDHKQFQITSAECLSSKKETKFFIRAFYDHDEKPNEHRFLVRMGQPGEYKFKEIFQLKNNKSV